MTYSTDGTDPRVEFLNEQNQQLAAILGLLVTLNDGNDFTVPFEVVEAGLPAGKGVHVEFDHEAEVMVVGIRDLPQ